MIQFPGWFTVLQGTPGDGMLNTIDDAACSTLQSLPSFNAERMLSSLETEAREEDSERAPSVRDFPNTSALSSIISSSGDASEVRRHDEATPILSEVSHAPERPTEISNLKGHEENHKIGNESTNDLDDDEDFETIQHSDSGIGTNHGSTTNSMQRTEHRAGPSRSIFENETRTCSIQQSSGVIDSETRDLIRQWNISCRQRQRSELKHILESYPSLTTAQGVSAPPSSRRPSLSNQNLDDFAWWQRRGELAVFATPTIHYPPITSNDSNHFDSPEGEEDDGEEDMMVLGTLKPGTVVKGLEIVRSFPPSPSALLRSAEVSSAGRNREIGVSSDYSKIEFLRIEEPLCGFIVYNVHDYALLAPGTPERYCSLDLFWWRVTCPDGAVVRRGLELSSPHVTTVPYGECLHVKQKKINITGLSRLFVLPTSCSDTEATTEGDGSNVSDVSDSKSNLSNTTSTKNSAIWRKQLSSAQGGWISQVLNPLSGQSGPIAQPLPFPVPALYEVVIDGGAVIRSGIELSSASLGTVPKGTVLPIVGRAFSEQPMDDCLVRLQLAGGGGWISHRLNRAEPENLLVVEFVGLDPNFDVRNPAIYHLKQLQQRLRQFPDMVTSLQEEVMHARADFDDASSLTSSFSRGHVVGGLKGGRDNSSGISGGDGGSKKNATARKQPFRMKEVREEKCVICLTEVRNATIVHGGTGHIACCLTCARILKSRGDKCPVCRLPIDLVIQQFWA